MSLPKKVCVFSLPVAYISNCVKAHVSLFTPQWNKSSGITME